MSFLEKAIRNGIRKGIGDAIGQAVQQAVEPAATKLVDKATGSIEQLTGQVQQSQQTYRQSSDLERALGNFQRSMEGYATEAAKNVKICPACNEPASLDKKFCPSCGAKLPEGSVAQGAVCSSCGKQNTVGTKFCSDCGAKLPAVLAEEAAESARGEEVLSKWEELLSVYPKWNCGGIPVDIEMIEPDQFVFTVDFKGDRMGAMRAVEQYRQFAQQSGFRQAGQYPSKENLYKKINGVCYHIDTEHCFDGDPDCPTLGFGIREPYGGYDYVKPEPKKKVTLRDLFK